MLGKSGVLSLMIRVRADGTAIFVVVIGVPVLSRKASTLEN